MTIETEIIPTMCTLQYWTQLDRGYNLEFPIEELGHAIALCGWTVASRIAPQSDEVCSEIRRLESLDVLDIPDGRRWFKMFGRPLQRSETKCLVDALSQAVEESGFSLSGAADWRAAENGEPQWVCNARAALALAGSIRPNPGPRMGEDNYRDGDGEGYIP